MNGPTPEKLLDTTYLTLEIMQNGYLMNSQTKYSIVSSIPIEYELCGNKFPNVRDDIYKRVELSSYIWPKNTDFFIQSDFNSDNYQTIEIKFKKWTGVGCKSNNEISDLIETHSIYVAILSSYFDFDDYEAPVHHYLQDLNIYGLVSSLTQVASYRVRRNQAHLNDNIWLGVQGKSTQMEFYSAYKDNYLISEIGTEQTLLQIYFNLDVHIDQYQRTVFSFLDLLGFIGGLFQIFKMFGFTFAFYFANKSYYFSVLSRLLVTDKEKMNMKYSLDLINAKRIPEINEEEKSSIGLNFKQNKVLPSYTMKSISFNNLHKLQCLTGEFKCNENINYQDISNLNGLVSKNKEDDHNLAIKKCIGKNSINYSFKDQLLELFCIHRWKSK